MNSSSVPLPKTPTSAWPCPLTFSHGISLIMYVMAAVSDFLPQISVSSMVVTVPRKMWRYFLFHNEGQFIYFDNKLDRTRHSLQ